MQLRVFRSFLVGTFILAVPITATLAQRVIDTPALPGEEESEPAAPAPAPVFSSRISFQDRAVIRQYYAANRGNLPSASARKKYSPYALQQHMRRNTTLPLGVAKRPLPYGLVSQLSPLPTGYERIIVGADIVLVNSTNRIILDVFADIVS